MWYGDKMVCSLAIDLKKMSKKMDEVKCYEEFELIYDMVDELCFEIANCKRKCGNDYCQGLQRTLYEDDYDY